MEVGPGQRLLFEIPAPPPEPRRPQGIRRDRHIPAVVGVGLVVGWLLTLVGPGTPLAIVVFLAIAAVGLIGEPYWEKAVYERRLKRRDQEYRNRLDILRTRLARLTTAQQSELAEHNPDAAGCLRLAVTAPDRIWQRHLDGPIEVRAGTIVGPSTVEVVAPRMPPRRDALFEAAHALAESAAHLNDIPVCMPLVERCAIQGPRSAALGAARSVLAQIATHYSPDELRLAVVFPESEIEAWRWARWLPHVHDASGRRLLGSNPSLLENLPSQPLVVLAHAALLPLVPRDVACLLVLNENEALPAGCTSVLANDASLRGTLRVRAAEQVVERVDAAPIEVADRLARALAGRTLAPPSDGEGIVEVHLDGSRTILQPRRV